MRLFAYDDEPVATHGKLTYRWIAVRVYVYLEAQVHQAELRGRRMDILVCRSEATWAHAFARIGMHSRISSWPFTDQQGTLIIAPVSCLP
jgi:hypothetical protein